MNRLAKSIRDWWNPSPHETGIVPILMDEVEAAPAPRAEEVKSLQTGVVQNILALERKSALAREMVSAIALAEMSGVRR